MVLLAAGGEINPLGHVLDKTLIEVNGTPILTLHMVTLIIAAALLYWVMRRAAEAIATGPSSEGHGRYLTKGRIAQMIEVITIYLRDEALGPVLGKEDTDKYLPYLMTLFFFILMNNLLGLVPLLDLQHLVGSFFGDSHFAWIGGTATGNIAVTAGLAIISFIVIQVHAFLSLGVRGWASHLLGGAPGWLFFIMIPVEFLGLLIKPTALAIRLFANMVAGHTLLATLSLFGLMAFQGVGLAFSGGITLVSGAFSVAITFLELFIAFLQAFIFMFLTAVFIAQMSHHDHEHEEHADTDHAAAEPA